MPDAPDWYALRPGSDRHVLADMAELAVRLFSPVVHDRRGTIIWVDDFRYGDVSWVHSTGGAGAAIAIDTHYPLYGGKVLKLTAGSSSPYAAQIYRNLSIPRVNKWGVAVHFAVTSNFDYISLSVGKYDGINRVQGRVRISDTDNTMVYRDSDGDNQLIATLSDLTETYGTYHWLKLVMDMSTKEYVRVMFDDTEYDLGGISLYESASGEVAQFRPYISLFGLSDENDVMCVDAVVITIDEP